MAAAASLLISSIRSVAMGVSRAGSYLLKRDGRRRRDVERFGPLAERDADLHVAALGNRLRQAIALGAEADGRHAVEGVEPPTAASNQRRPWLRGGVDALPEQGLGEDRPHARPHGVGAERIRTVRPEYDRPADQRLGAPDDRPDVARVG